MNNLDEEASKQLLTTAEKQMKTTEEQTTTKEQRMTQEPNREKENQAQSKSSNLILVILFAFALLVVIIIFMIVCLKRGCCKKPTPTIDRLFPKEDYYKLRKVPKGIAEGYERDCGISIESIDEAFYEESSRESNSFILPAATVPTKPGDLPGVLKPN